MPTTNPQTLSDIAVRVVADGRGVRPVIVADGEVIQTLDLVESGDVVEANARGVARLARIVDGVVPAYDLVARNLAATLDLNLRGDWVASTDAGSWHFRLTVAPDPDASTDAYARDGDWFGRLALFTLDEVEAGDAADWIALPVEGSRGRWYWSPSDHVAASATDQGGALDAQWSEMLRLFLDDGYAILAVRATHTRPDGYSIEGEAHLGAVWPWQYGATGDAGVMASVRDLVREAVEDVEARRGDAPHVERHDPDPVGMLRWAVEREASDAPAPAVDQSTWWARSLTLTAHLVRVVEALAVELDASTGDPSPRANRIRRDALALLAALDGLDCLDGLADYPQS